MVMIEEVSDEDDTDKPLPPIARSREVAHYVHMPAAFIAAACTPPVDALIIPNPYKAYLRESVINQSGSDIVVAVESSALRVVLPIVNGQDRVKAILDPGCQIVAMSEEVSNALALSYDPTI